MSRTASGAPQAPATRSVTSADAAAILREIADGRRGLRLLDPRRPWVQVAVGEVSYQAGDCRIVFFSDSATLDHVVSLATEGGESIGFEQWLMRDGSNPVDLLDDSDRLALEQRLAEAG